MLSPVEVQLSDLVVRRGAIATEVFLKKSYSLCKSSKCLVNNLKAYRS